MPPPSLSLVAAGYDAVYEAVPRSTAFGRLWAEHASGRDYPEGFEHISFLTLAEMRRVSGFLALKEDGALVDLACGAGGPGLWLARSARARVIGIDISMAGLIRARERAARVGMVTCSTFVSGSFASTGLTDQVADAVISIDAVQYAPDKRGAFAEVKRILAPGGRFVFTAFEVTPSRVAGLPVLSEDPVADLRPVLEQAGFQIECYEETAGWRDRVVGTYRAVLEAQAALTEELGDQAYAVLAWEIVQTLERDFYRRRVLAVATRP